MKLRSDYRAAVLITPRIRRTIEDPGQQERIQQGQEVFSEDYFSSARVDRHTDGNIGLHLQVPRGSTHPNGVG